MIPSQMLKGLLEGCVLEIIHQKETYAYEISSILKDNGFGDISEGTIYPLLLRLQKQNLIEGTIKKSDYGPNRKYYHLTQRGYKHLKGFKTSYNMLNQAINNLFKGDKDATQD